jgi:hypothetical protein
MKRFGNSVTAAIIGIFCFLFSVYANAAEREYVDDNTQSTSGKSMHICGVGLMSGMHLARNDLLCNLLPRAEPGFDDWYTQRSGMHACPVGTAMMGIHTADNVLRCSIPTNKTLLIGTEYVESSIQRAGMNTCPKGWVMTGVHASSNLFLCTQLGN